VLIAVLLLTPVCLGRIIDLGKIYHATFVTYEPSYYGLLNVSVDFDETFYVYAYGDLFSGEPIIYFKVTNDTNELNLLNGTFLTDNVTLLGPEINMTAVFPNTTKILYYLVALDFGKIENLQPGNYSLTLKIYAPNETNVIQEDEIRFELLVGPDVPSTLPPPHVRSLMITSGLMIIIGVLYILIRGLI